MTLADELAAVQPSRPAAPGPRELPGEAPPTDQPSPTPPEKIEALGALERSASRAQLNVAGVASKLIAGELPSTLAMPKNLDRAHLLQQLGTVQQLALNPQAKVDWITARTQDLAEHAPATALQAAQTLSRGLDYLASIAPSTPPPTLFSTKPSEPSQEQLLHWAVAAHAVSSPLEAIEQGGVSPDALNALQAVYPALHGALRSAVTDELATQGPPKTVSARTQTAKLLGLDEAQQQDQAAIAVLTAKPARAPAPVPAMEPRRNPGVAANARMAGSYQTTSERLASHSLGAKY